MIKTGSQSEGTEPLRLRRIQLAKKTQTKRHFCWQAGGPSVGHERFDWTGHW